MCYGGLTHFTLVAATATAESTALFSTPDVGLVTQSQRSYG